MIFVSKYLIAKASQKRRRRKKRRKRRRRKRGGREEEENRGREGRKRTKRKLIFLTSISEKEKALSFSRQNFSY